jgi:hypothetical protein
MDGIVYGLISSHKIPPRCIVGTSIFVVFDWVGVHPGKQDVHHSPPCFINDKSPPSSSQ